MRCLLIFDYSNDIIYTKYNKKFAIHINECACSQGLLKKEKKNAKIAPNIIVQIFSPIVTSQRIMSCQFGNSYTSIQCEDGLNMALEEYMGFLFVGIGCDDITSMKRFLSVCVTLVRYTCGPNVLLLKSNSQICQTVTHLIDSWIYLHHTEQSILVEAIEQLIVNSDLSSTALQALKEAVDKLQSVGNFSKVHALVFVQNKFLALYSSRNATSLSPSDMLFLILLSNVNNLKNSQDKNDPEFESDDEFYSPLTSPISTCKFHDLIAHRDFIQESSYQVLFAGSDFTPKCIPHVVHVSQLTQGVDLLLILETGNIQVSSGLYDTFYYLNAIQTVQMQQDNETLKPAFENLDTAMKKLTDGLKRAKNSLLDLTHKQLIKHWDGMRKKYMDFIKNGTTESLIRAESLTMGFLDTLKELLHLTARDNSVLNSSQIYVNDITRMVSNRLKNFNEFFKAKALMNFSLGSRDSLTINKYLEEFPGLVHFLYVDRTSHRVTTPTLDFTSSETLNLTKKKIWSMIHFSRNHLQEGHLSFMWKDTTFNYAYFLWFEDNSGSPIKPIIFPTNAPKVLPQPGILCRDFYQKLKEICFPKMAPTKVRCYELFCIHLGLATFACVLEQTRRLAATVWELKGHPNHPIDLL